MADRKLWTQSDWSRPATIDMQCDKPMIKNKRFWMASLVATVASIAVFSILFAVVSVYLVPEAAGESQTSGVWSYSVFVFAHAFAIFVVPVFGLVTLSGSLIQNWRYRAAIPARGLSVVAVGTLEGLLLVGGGWWLLTTGSPRHVADVMMLGVGAVVGAVGGAVFLQISSGNRAPFVSPPQQP